MRTLLWRKKKLVLCHKIRMVLFFLLLLGRLSVHAEERYTEGFFQYTVAKEEVTIHSYFGKETEVTIPEKIAGYPVTMIKDSTFFNKDEVKTVVVPYTVTSVDEQTFLDMKHLERIILKSDQVNVRAAEYVIVVEDFPRFVNTDEKTGDKEDKKEEKKEDKKDKVSEQKEESMDFDDTQIEPENNKEENEGKVDKEEEKNPENEE